MLPKNRGETSMGAPAIFEKQIEIKLLHPASSEGVTDSGNSLCAFPGSDSTLPEFWYMNCSALI
ncbi:MAG: hypothetical protein P8X74_20890 [Reinekea sp.]